MPRAPLTRSRISLAWMGTGYCRASSTAARAAMAWVPVQTPQMRSTKAHTSRGSRLQAITSMPRYCVVDVQAFLITPSPASISTRRWPSMRVTGSMTTRLDSGTAADV